MSADTFEDGAAFVAALTAASAADLASTTNFLMDAYQEQARTMARAYVALFDRVDNDPNVSRALGRFLDMNAHKYEHAMRLIEGEDAS